MQFYPADTDSGVRVSEKLHLQLRIRAANFAPGQLMGNKFHSWIELRRRPIMVKPTVRSTECFVRDGSIDGAVRSDKRRRANPDREARRARNRPVSKHVAGAIARFDGRSFSRKPPAARRARQLLATQTQQPRRIHGAAAMPTRDAARASWTGLRAATTCELSARATV
jgi:hypothetical protein